MIKFFTVFYDEEAIEFIEGLDLKVKKKILSVIRRAQYEKDPRFFKKLTKDIWEFRINFSEQYRLLAFWSAEQKSVVICTHGFKKTTKKTPASQIEKANRIRQGYRDNIN